MEFVESAFSLLDSGTLTSILLKISPQDVVQLCSLSIELDSKCSKIFWTALFNEHFPDEEIPRKAKQRERYSELAEEYSYYEMNPEGNYLGEIVLGYKNIAKYDSTNVLGWIDKQIFNTHLIIRGKRLIPGSKIWAVIEIYELNNVYNNYFEAFDNYEDAVDVAIDMATKGFALRDENLEYISAPGNNVVEAINNPWKIEHTYIVWEKEEGQGGTETYTLQLILLTLE